MSMERDEREHVNRLAQRVSTLERQLIALYQHLGITPPADGPPLDEIAELLRIGNKLEAIQRYREHTGADLATAKTAIEQLAAQLGFA